MLRCQPSSSQTAEPAAPQLSPHSFRALLLQTQNKQDNDLHPQLQLVLMDPGEGSLHVQLCSQTTVLKSKPSSPPLQRTGWSHSCAITEMQTAASRGAAPLTARGPEIPSRFQAKEIPLAGREGKAEGGRPAGDFPCQTSSLDFIEAPARSSLSRAA